MKSDIRNLDLNLLKALDALLDERSVTRAAARLALTQPAVSGMLTRLRDAFNAPLFIRAPHGMVPTLRAQALAAPVKQLLIDAETLLQPAIFEPLEANFTWTIAATDYALKAVIVPFIAALKPLAPGIRVRIIPESPATLLAQSERGEVDIALLTPHDTPPALHSRALYQEDYVCLMREDHPQASQPLTLDRFCALEHVLVSWQGASFRRAGGAWANPAGGIVGEQFPGVAGNTGGERHDRRGTAPTGEKSQRHENSPTAADDPGFHQKHGLARA